MLRGYNCSLLKDNVYKYIGGNIIFTLALQDITINCESVKLREFKLNSSLVYLDHLSYINSLLPYKNYTIQMKVTNNKDLSTEAMLVIETWELGALSII